jgi:hypothetical protein
MGKTFYIFQVFPKYLKEIKNENYGPDINEQVRKNYIWKLFDINSNVYKNSLFLHDNDNYLWKFFSINDIKEILKSQLNNIIDNIDKIGNEDCIHNEEIKKVKFFKILLENIEKRENEDEKAIFISYE